MSSATRGGGRPAPGLFAHWLPRIDSDDPRHPAVSDAAAAAWEGVVWGRLGRGDRAWDRWDTVTDPSLGPWVAAERGRVLRELGLHAEARMLELEGLESARDVTDVVMLRLSLAADALGDAPGGQPADVDAAERALGIAVTLLDELPPGPRTDRQRLRASWIGVEVALARDVDPDATGLPWQDESGPVFPAEYDAGTDFHRSKGLLVAGVARGDTLFLEQSAAIAPPALSWAVELARAGAGIDGALQRATAAWQQVVPPQDHADDVAAPAAIRGAQERR